MPVHVIREEEKEDEHGPVLKPTIGDDVDFRIDGMQKPPEEEVSGYLGVSEADKAAAAKLEKERVAIRDDRRNIPEEKSKHLRRKSDAAPFSLNKGDFGPATLMGQSYVDYGATTDIEARMGSIRETISNFLVNNLRPLGIKLDAKRDIKIEKEGKININNVEKIIEEIKLSKKLSYKELFQKGVYLKAVNSKKLSPEEREKYLKKLSPLIAKEKKYKEFVSKLDLELPNIIRTKDMAEAELISLYGTSGLPNIHVPTGEKNYVPPDKIEK